MTSSEQQLSQLICIPTQIMLCRLYIHFYMELVAFSTSFVEIRVAFRFQFQLPYKYRPVSWVCWVYSSTASLFSAKIGLGSFGLSPGIMPLPFYFLLQCSVM